MKKKPSRNRSRPRVTAADAQKIRAALQPEPDPIPIEDEPEERYRLYRLCPCTACKGGQVGGGTFRDELRRCDNCRGEGRVRERVATCPDPQSVGVAIVTLALEGEFEECPIGLLDTQGEVGQKWLINPWLPSARNVRDAAKVLAGARKGAK